MSQDVLCEVVVMTVGLQRYCACQYTSKEYVKHLWVDRAGDEGGVEALLPLKLRRLLVPRSVRLRN